MPRIRDARNDSLVLKVLRGIAFVVAVIVGGVLLREVAHEYGDPKSALERYREPAIAPHVHIRGTLERRAPTSKTSALTEGLGALCSVNHERWQQCGKNRCWRYYEGFRYSNASVTVKESSSPVRATMEPGAKFHFEPWHPPDVVVTGQRARDWRSYATKNGLGFKDSDFSGADVDRIVESCVEPGTPVFIEACVSPTDAGYLEPCPGQDAFGLIANGDAQAARDDFADLLARYLGGVAALLFVATFAWLRVRRPIMEGLEDRAAPHRRKLGWAWGILGVPPVLVFSVILMHASIPPSTWSTGRGGFAFLGSMLAVWFVFFLSRWLDRTRLLSALAPVLATPRSLLAEASGTVELAVKARGSSLKAFIGDDPVAYSEIIIKETTRQGKNTSTNEVYRSRQHDRLEVVDESGEGVLDLSRSILDVEQRTVDMVNLSDRYRERGILPVFSPNHVRYTVYEWVIRDGEPLYVFGDVSDIALKADEAGYRAVRGSPTLGGKDAAPVLVHSGDERGLIALLTTDARAANSFAVIAACVCTALSATLVALAMI